MSEQRVPLVLLLLRTASDEDVQPVCEITHFCELSERGGRLGLVLQSDQKWQGFVGLPTVYFGWFA